MERILHFSFSPSCLLLSLVPRIPLVTNSFLCLPRSISSASKKHTLVEMERLGAMPSNTSKFINSHEDLEVYRIAFDTAMTIFEISKNFPKEERSALTDPIRRSSRSVCANLGEAWRRPKDKGSFQVRLNDAEAEAAETQVWLKFAVKCGYLDIDRGRELDRQYNQILGSIVRIIQDSDRWLLQN
ncbi:MAG: four helix bundle protein [Cyanobacteriota bacterium]|nr:four helix bundle protein [Cyanobacteriota bacterium]